MKRTRKRPAQLPQAAEARLKERLRDILLPPALKNRKPVTLKQFAEGKFISDAEARRIESDVHWRVERCFPPFFSLDRRSDEPQVPDQIEDKREWIKNADPEYVALCEGYPSDDDLIIYLLHTDLEIEPETKAYLAREWSRRVPLPSPPDPDSHYRDFAECIKRVKRLLITSGSMKAEQAEQVIADALGIERSALLKRLQRASKK
jgi:hypothetical protein